MNVGPTNMFITLNWFGYQKVNTIFRIEYDLYLLFVKKMNAVFDLKQSLLDRRRMLTSFLPESLLNVSITYNSFIRRFTGNSV